METKSYSQPVNLPTLEEFQEKYSSYGKFAGGEGRPLFEHIVSPKSFIYAMVATTLGHPAVAGIADDCFVFVNQTGTTEWRNFTKQFIGAVVCSLMEANGYQKTGKKKSVPHPAFTVGEFYKLPEK